MTHQHTEARNLKKRGTLTEPLKLTELHYMLSEPLLKSTGSDQHQVLTPVVRFYGAPFVKILYLTDLAQKLLSLRIFNYLCAHLAISAQR